MAVEERPSYQPRLVGSAENVYQILAPGEARNKIPQSGENPVQKSIPSKYAVEPVHPASIESNYFKSAQWSPDARPPDLLFPLTTPHTLKPYSQHPQPEPIYATTFFPSYNLQDTTSTLFLSSLRSLPIRLLSPFSSSIVASYPLVSPTTEVFTAPHSLLFSPNQPHQFFAGSASLISTFDINRNGEGPLNRMPTTPSRRSSSIASGGLKGIISALSIGSSGILAAGTFTRCVGLYNSSGHGDTIAVFPIHNPTIDDRKEQQGTGITQLLWSACGRYLCVVERGSDGIGVWDIRGTGRKLAWLAGRNARTNKRLSVDLISDEIWAGGTDGNVRVWEGAGMKEGVVEPVFEFHAHDDAVSSTVLHPTGSVLATCSGQRRFSTAGLPARNQEKSIDGESESESESDSDSDDSSSASSSKSPSSFTKSELHSPSGNRFDNSLRIWAL